MINVSNFNIYEQLVYISNVKLNLANALRITIKAGIKK
jgi:hypothetical protein